MSVARGKVESPRGADTPGRAFDAARECLTVEFLR